MRLLLDTHAFVWWDISPKRLPSHVHGAMIDPNNTVLLSVASVWEMQIKLQLGKMQLTRPLLDVVQSEQKANRIQLLSVAVEHIWALAPLPWHHKDRLTDS